MTEVEAVHVIKAVSFEIKCTFKFYDVMIHNKYWWFYRPYGCTQEGGGGLQIER